MSDENTAVETITTPAVNAEGAADVDTVTAVAEEENPEAHIGERVADVDTDDAGAPAAPAASDTDF